jgi:hypothetical protein
MIRNTFRKTLSSNDVGATGGHQGGLLVPKSESELLQFLPPLNAATKNPDSWIECVDEHLNTFKFRYVYYNNKLHDQKGTRNEYRITYMTVYFRDAGARAGDVFEISKAASDRRYSIRIVKTADAGIAFEDGPLERIKLTGWRRAH